MPQYETMISFTYDADDPRDAAVQFFDNLAATPSWYILVRDTETGETWDVDAQTGDVQEMGAGDDWVAWPDEPGFYWFFGHTNYKWADRHGDKPKLMPVRARRIGDGSIMVDFNGDFIWHGKQRGLFKRMTLPVTSDLDIWEDTDVKSD